MEEIRFLRDLVIVFGCATPVVYLFHRLKQSPIVGFMVSGMLVGPYGLSLIADTDSVRILAAIGVMILLFSLGLEFSLKKLMETRIAVFVTGPLQMAGTIVPVMLAARYWGAPLRTGFVYGALVAVSSTAVLMKMLVERAEVNALHGRVALGISIFQDLCTVPLIIAIPLLGRGETAVYAMWRALAWAVVVVVVVVVVARYLFPLLLEGILRTRSKELFLVTSIFMFLGTAWVTSKIGITLALGSFLAGLILSESEYGHQIFAEVRPFRDSLNSLFFISVGMLADPAFIVHHAWLVAGITVAVVIGKTVVITGAAAASRIAWTVGLLSGAALAQVGEFSFIMLQAASDAGLVQARAYQAILAASLVSMVLAPPLFAAVRKLGGTIAGRGADTRGRVRALPAVEEAAVGLHDHVIICGFGVGGHSIATVLKADGIPYVIVDLNAQSVREAARAGETVIFGDCTSTHILERAGIARARVIVLVISDPFATRLAVGTARRMNREIAILTRTKYVADIDDLWDLGSTEVIAEEFEAALEMVTRILRLYNAPRAMVAAQIKSIREQRFGIFREHRATVPRIRLSGDLDVYAETWEMPQGCAWDGAKIAQTRLRSESGALILGIIRGGRTLNNPDPDERLYVGDRIVMSGTKEQLKKAFEILERCPPLPHAG